MTNYVIYCRKSSTWDKKQVQSIPDQIKRCKEFAKANWLTIAKRPRDFEKLFLDQKSKQLETNASARDKKIFQSIKDEFVVTESQTWKIPGKRKKRNKIVKMIKKWEITWLISYSPDRQARNILEWWELINLVDENKIDLKYTNFHFENTASGKMMLGVWFVFAKQYSDWLSEWITRWIDETVDRGKNMWHNVRWYRRRWEWEQDEWYLEPDENWEIVYKAFQMKLYEKKTNTDIAQWMNDQWFKYQYGKRTIYATAKWLSRIFKVEVFYWLYCIWDRQIDLNEEWLWYFKPIISKEEYYILQDLLLKKKWGQSFQKSKKENELLDPLPKQVLFWFDWGTMSFNLPNKRRHRENLEELQKTNKKAVLEDVIKLSQISYKANNEKKKDVGLIITADLVVKAISKKLRSIKISQKDYEYYMSVLGNKLKQQTKENSELMRQNTRQLNYRNEKLSDFIAEKWHLKVWDEKERKVYRETKSELEQKIQRITSEQDDIKADTKNNMIEFEMFLDVFKNIGEYYDNAPFVRQRKIIKLFISNIKISKKKRLTVEVKPSLKSIFNSKLTSGGGDGSRTRV